MNTALTLTEVSRPSKVNFKSHLCDLLLSMSPYLRYDVPYLESTSGAKSEMRKFLPQKLFNSLQFEDSRCRLSDVKRKLSTTSLEDRDVSMKTTRDRLTANGVHPFQTAQLNGLKEKTSTQVKRLVSMKMNCMLSRYLMFCILLISSRSWPSFELVAVESLQLTCVTQKPRN